MYIIKCLYILVSYMYTYMCMYMCIHVYTHIYIYTSPVLNHQRSEYENINVLK